MAQLAVGEVQNFTFELVHKKGYIDLGNGLNLIHAHGYTSQNDFEIHKTSDFHTEHISHGNRYLQNLLIKT